MPSSLKDYRNREKMKAYRNRARKRNYDRGFVDSHHRKWTTEEYSLILASNKTDRELSQEINRSVVSIQVKRNRLNKIKDKLKLDNLNCI